MPNESNDQTTISLLKKRVGYLRVTVYLFVAISILLTSLILYWQYTPSEESFETFYSKAPQPPRASLYLSPKEGNYSVDDEFSVDVLINTEGSNVVASAAYLSYNKEKMEAVEINTTDSVFDMQAEKDINAKDGKIKITMGKPTPGIREHAGKVATIRFKALQKTTPYVENITFDFTKGSSLYSTIIIDDKKGTNILDATRGAKIFIN